MENNIVIGVDMGATHTRICVMKLNREVLITERYKTKEIIGKGFIQGLISLCSKFAPIKQINRIVIGLPASITADRKKVLSAPNLHISKQELDNLNTELYNHFNCPIFLERDVNLQLIYDIHHYKLADKLALGIYLGTGIGFSIWNKGNLFIGANGVAGELGHIPYGNDNTQCSCGNYGCLETACSGVVLKNWYDAQNFSFPIDLIFERVQDNAFIQQLLINIAKAVSTTVNLFDPEILILGGGIMDMQGFPIKHLKTLIGKYIRKPLPYNNLTILKAESSSFNGAIGAALYALQH